MAKGRTIFCLWLFSSDPSPKLRARSHTACVNACTRIFSLYENQWFVASTRAWSISVCASAVMPLMAAPMWRSISMIFSMLPGSSSGDVRRFSTANTTPSLVRIPIAVVPICTYKATLLDGWIPPSLSSQDRTLMASMAYSTWNKRPSGEKVLTPRSYSVLQHTERQLLMQDLPPARPLRPKPPPHTWSGTCWL